jgi:hypothetical protein
LNCPFLSVILGRNIFEGRKIRKEERKEGYGKIVLSLVKNNNIKTKIKGVKKNI